jgi:hypothetical protein
MIMTPQEYTYQDIVDFLADYDQEISLSAICRYAKRLNADMQAAVMNQENLRRVTEAMNRYPDLDYVEVLMVIAAQKLIDRINSAPDEQWEAMDIDDAVKNITSLARTKTYKRRTDSTIKSKEEIGMQAAMDKIFDALGREHPELYNKVYDAVKAAAENEKALKNGGTE